MLLLSVIMIYCSCLAKKHGGFFFCFYRSCGDADKNNLQCRIELSTFYGNNAIVIVISRTDALK